MNVAEEDTYLFHTVSTGEDVLPQLSLRASWRGVHHVSVHEKRGQLHF